MNVLEEFVDYKYIGKGRFVLYNGKGGSTEAHWSYFVRQSIRKYITSLVCFIIDHSWNSGNGPTRCQMCDKYY